MQRSKLLRYAFWAVWFVAAPLALAALAVWLLKPADATEPSGIVGQLRWLVQDQPAPAGIVLFTIFEMLLYHFRHALPFAAAAGVVGRSDLPPDLRREYERAAALLEEAERILTRKSRAVERQVPASAREELEESLEFLRSSMESERFDDDEFGAALERASRLVARHLGRWHKSELREYVESIGIAVAVALLLRAFVVEAFKIPSGSMLPTLQIQDHIFVNKFVYGPEIPFTHTRLFARLPPKRGDVLVFEYPDPNPENPRQDFIKRVIGLPGDTLEADGGHPIINGWKVPSCDVGQYDFYEGDGAGSKTGQLVMEFLGDYSYLTVYENDRYDGHQGPYHVAPGEMWVFGDNRNNSSDSRAWNNYRGGGAPFANIKGRAMFVWLSFGPDGKITWDRLLHEVLGRPVLPKGAPADIVKGIQSCLAKRPAVTTPPPPKG
ncbi:MAG: signal peptidase I [Sorangiineae bacterium]|nr:signal peptidase I [Polyangiaceae bacterium]MEB2324997.1 signal peptidase I [Sorangiineae bacterium]